MQYSYEQDQYDDAPLSRLGLAPVQLLLNVRGPGSSLRAARTSLPRDLRWHTRVRGAALTSSLLQAPAASHPLTIPKKTVTPASTPVAISLTPSKPSPVKVGGGLRTEGLADIFGTRTDTSFRNLQSSKALPAKTASGFLRLQ